jgi:O-acetyl-ADP-ribose deacetylase
MEKIYSGVKIETVNGDIAAQTDLKAVVNAANAQLRIGGGVAGALHRAAGPGLEEECRPLAPIKPGEAVLTGGHNLPNDYVIHCLGPVYGVDKPETELLANCYKNALRLADEKGIESIGFPSISSGAFGYPIEAATAVAFHTLKEAIPALHKIKLIRFVLFGQDTLRVHEEWLLKMFG